MVTPFGVLDQNVLVSKRMKVEKQGGGDAEKKNEKDGGGVVAATQHRQAK